MRRSTVRASLTIAGAVIVAAISPLVLGQASGATGDDTGASTSRSAKAPWTTEVRTGSDAAAERLGPQLAAIAEAGGSEPVLVTLLTVADPHLDDVAEAWRATAVPLGEGRTVAALVRPDRLTKLALHPDVLAVIPPGELPSPVGNEEYETLSPPPGQVSPDLWYSRQGLGADRAEANGFDGTGVIVGIEDSGVDFGHPDLRGTFARVADPTSPYAGYPLVYDDVSATSYVLRNGDPSGTYYADSRASFAADVPFGQQSTAVVTVPATRIQIVGGQQQGTATTVTRSVRYNNYSRSGRIYYGVHPDSTLVRTEVAAGVTHTLGAVFLVMDQTTAGDYDSVYTDLGDQNAANALVATYDFRTLTPAQLGPGLDPTVSKDIDGDGLADLSGGLIYFIADGTHHVPILDWMWDADGHVDPTKRIAPPAVGTLVAFYGDYGGNSHGTGVATQIAGQGIINSRFGAGVNTPPGTGATDGDIVVGGVTPGMAPGAKLFASRYLGVPNQWIALTRGYDGVPNTADDAQVINNSWGNTSLPSSVQNATDYAATALNAPERSPRTLFVVSTGNGGQGFSTISSPSSGSTVFAVGAANQYGSDEITSIISSSLQLSIGDPASFTSVGPDLQGRPGVAVLAVGNSASGGAPLNLVRSPQGRYNGNNAWIQFGGTSQAGPQATGVAALVFQAYKQRTGTWPTWNRARSLLQFGASDQDLGPAVQGAGLANADQSTAVAAGLYGPEISSSEWQVGDYRGTRYQDFPNLARRGAQYSRTFTVANRSGVQLGVSVASDRFVPIRSQDIEVQATLANESPYSYKRPDYLITPQQLNIPAGTELMQVRVAQEFSHFCTEDPAGLHLGCGVRGSSAWYLRAYMWIDWNKNGRVWTDLNNNGVVNENELDLPTTPTFAAQPDPRTSYELSPIGETNLSGNTQDLRIRQPLTRGGDGLYLAFVHRARNQTVPQDTLRLRVTYYRRQPWSPLALSKTSFSLGAGASETFVATYRVPADAAYGFYEGDIRITSQPGNNPRAGIRMMSVVPGSEAVDFYVDDRRVATNLRYGSLTGTPYVDVDIGQRRIRVVPTGASLSEAVVDRYLDFRSGTEYTLAEVRTSTGATVQAIIDGNVTPERGRSRVRFGQLSPDVGLVDVFLNNQRVLSRVAYRDISRFLSVPDGRYTVRVTPSGETATLLSVGPTNLTGASITAYMIGERAAQTLSGVTATGAARTHYPRQISSVPVVANVVAEGGLDQSVQYGGLPPADSLYDIGRVYGLYDWRGNGTARQGDWRNFYLDVPETAALPAGARFLAHTQWTNVPTDIDVLAFVPQARRVDTSVTPPTEAIAVGGSLFPVDPDVSGPYDLSMQARTADTAHAANGSSGTAYSFRTVTGGPEEWLTGPLSHGLHMFAHQNVLSSGASPAGEAFRTTLGSASVVPESVNILSPDDTGTFQVSVQTSLDLLGLEAAAYGLEPRQVYSDSVATSSPPGNLGDPQGNRYYPLTLSSSGYLEITLRPNADFVGYDLDLYLQLKNPDGSYATVAQSGGPAAEEDIDVFGAPDGEYRVVVNGFSAPPGTGFTLTIMNAAGNDLTVSGATSDTIPAGTTTRLTVTFHLDYEEGKQNGMLFIGPKGAPMVFQVPVAITRGEAGIYLPMMLKGL